MIYERDGTYTISSRGVWMPGVYEDERTARYAFRFSDETLSRLQDEANTRAGGIGGVITWGDLARAAPEDKRMRATWLETKGDEHGA